ncbi:MAG TPA: hypothetical protein VGR76_00425, partial [Candidatus Angelobacter sp.]|nr:hypothetical protein [Candidatus Angelobacter sp.]
ERNTLALVQQSSRLQAKIAPVVMASALLQEAVTLNQQLAQQVTTLLTALTNERKSKLKAPCPDAGALPSEARTEA